MKKGLTLLELIFTIVMFVVVIGTAVYCFRAILISWSSNQLRAGTDITLDRAIEEMTRVLREAKAVESNNDEIRFTDISDTSYIFYFYNEDDPYPPQFDQSLYELRKAVLVPDINGVPVEIGDLLITDVLPPTVSDMSFDGSTIVIDLSVSRDSEVVRSRTEIKPRNI